MIMVHVQQEKLMNSRGETISCFSTGESFLEINNGFSCFIERVGKKPQVICLGVSSAIRLPTTIHK